MNSTIQKRFIKYIPSEEAEFLLTKPYANALLQLIVIRAKRIDDPITGLKAGECFIGDHESIGATRQQYRTALKVLVSRKYLTILETCRTRKKSTTGSTTVGTKVKLLNSVIWDININDNNHQVNQCPTTDQPPTNHEQERIRKNKNEKEEKEKNIKKEKIAFREFVHLTQSEFDKLVATSNLEFVNIMLDTLNAYKGGSGKEYKSDYFTMAQGGWVFKQVTKDKADVKANEKSNSSSSKPQFRGQKVLSITGGSAYAS